MQEEFLKITGAVYKILDTLPEGDPLKNKAKEKVLAIMENAAVILNDHGWLSLKKYLLQDKEHLTRQLLQDLEMLESYLVIAKHQGWISSMNFLIIIKEYESLKSKVNASSKIIAKETLLLANANQAPVAPVQVLPKNRSQKPAKKDIPAQEENQLSKKALQRHQKILGILSKRQKAQVADLIKELPNVTKRTIRRDLDDLLKRQKIVRSGEWNQVFYTISQKRG